MGNQLLKGYTMQGEPVSCVGCEKMWRIYQGIKTSTNQSVTIFAIQKRALNKADRDELIKFAKKQAMGLARIRHPGVLAISQTLIEDENILAFSTEPILGNLTMLSKQNKLSAIVSNEIELRLNLFPLLDTIQFLHDNVKTVHLTINFDNIYITKQGKWKIAGFSNSQIYTAQQLQQLDNGFRCADLSYAAPEIVFQKMFEKRSDVYSLGVLILNLLQVLYGQYNDRPITTKSEYEQRNQKQLIQKINNSDIEKIENYRQLRVLLKNIFTKNVQQRISMYELSNSKWLNDKLVLAVRYLQNITNYDSKQQIEFLKGLMGILNHFSNKILLRKIIPGLMDLLKFKHLIPSIIYIAIQILKDGKILKNSEFLQYIWPHIRKVLQGKEITANSLYLIVDHIPVIERIVNLDQLTQTVMPLYIKCFDCPPKLKILALHKTEYILSKMDYQFVKAKFLPKIMSCMKDSNSEVHKKSLIALRKCIKILDVQTITSQVLGGLQNSRKAGTDPFINAISISIYIQLAKTLPTQILSSKLIPTILPYLTDPSVTAEDFYNYKKTMLTMLQKIQIERKKYWEENKNSSNQYQFTEQDFQFEEEIKAPENTSSPQIGTGSYEFLSNYNNNSRKEDEETGKNYNRNQSQEQYGSGYGNNGQAMKRNDYDSFDRSANRGPNQNNRNNSNPINQINRGMGHQNRNTPQYQPFEQSPDPWSNLSADSPGLSQPKKQEEMTSYMNREYQQPSYTEQKKPQNNPSYPKLKGPTGPGGIKKPPVSTQNNSYQPNKPDPSDPWATLDNLTSEMNQNKGYSHTNQTTGIGMGYGGSHNTSSTNYDMGMNYGEKKQQSSDPWSFAQSTPANNNYSSNYNTSSTSYSMDFGSKENNTFSYGNTTQTNINNYGQSSNNGYDPSDPFAGISSGNSGGMSMNTNYMGMNFQSSSTNTQPTYTSPQNPNLQTTNSELFPNPHKQQKGDFDFDLI